MCWCIKLRHHQFRYRIAGNFVGVKFCRIAKFLAISGFNFENLWPCPLSMHIMVQIVGFILVNGYQNSKFAKMFTSKITSYTVFPIQQGNKLHDETTHSLKEKKRNRSCSNLQKLAHKIPCTIVQGIWPNF